MPCVIQIATSFILEKIVMHEILKVVKFKSAHSIEGIKDSDDV